MSGCRGINSKYQPDYARQARVACAEGGFSDVKLAKLFNVCKATITNWKKENPDFLASVKEGKEIFDTENVEKSLLKRALGYRFNETVKELDPITTKMVTTKVTRKDVAGDVKAQTFWLRNRNRERWPDTQKLDGNLNLKMSHEEMLDELEKTD